MCTSTISVAFSKELATAHHARRQGYVAAPVLGRQEAAGEKQLWVMAADRRTRWNAAGRSWKPLAGLGGIFWASKTKAKCERYRAAMKAENVPASLPEGSAILPVQPHVEHKRTVHPAWPSFTSEHGRTIQCGAACCPRTLGILTVSRGFAGSDFYGERHGRHRRRDPEGLSTNCASLAVSGPAHRRPTFGGTLLGAQ